MTQFKDNFRDNEVCIIGLGCDDIPLIYSSHISEWQIKNAALLVYPGNSDEIVKATILKALKRLISNGHKRLFDVSRERKNAEKEFSEIINKFSLRRECRII